MLLTGDARGDQIVDGLRAAARLTNGTFEVDVLKVPHHGSENNIDSDFVEAVIAPTTCSAATGGAATRIPM